MGDSTNRKHEIQQAALNEFTKEGLSGTRLQAIADNIGVTKAMIHYYFGTKENLFRQVFHYACEDRLQGLFDILETQLSLFQKIEQFVDETLKRIADKPGLAGFIINELNNHPDITTEIFREIHSGGFPVLDEQLKEAAENYEIAPVAHDQLIANILSLCMFSFTGRTFLQEILLKDEKDYEQFLEERKEIIKDTIINWLAG